MSEKFPNNQENVSPEEWLRRTRKVLEQISLESEEEDAKRKEGEE